MGPSELQSNLDTAIQAAAVFAADSTEMECMEVTESTTFVGHGLGSATTLGRTMGLSE